GIGVDGTERGLREPHHDDVGLPHVGALVRRGECRVEVDHLQGAQLFGLARLGHLSVRSALRQDCAGESRGDRANREFHFLQPKRAMRSTPNTDTPLLLSSTAATAVPSSRALAIWASQCASMAIFPMTVTLERKQYQPLGFASQIVVLPMTLTAGCTRMSLGLSVISSSMAALPMPNTFTPVEKTLAGGVPFLNGEFP